MQAEKQIYNLTLQEVLEKFQTSVAGLSEDEAKRRLAESGKNQVVKIIRWRWIKLVLNQFNDALVWILLVAGVLAIIFDAQRDAVIIAMIIGINATIGFVQEFKAERILDSIRKLTTDNSLVFRDGKKREIDSREIVPGDLIFVAAGDNVPADGYISESYELKVSSFIFSGESAPEKKSGKVLAGEFSLADIDNMLFGGEVVTSGEANFIVTATGMKSELGKIAHITQEIKEEQTPLQKKMQRFGRNIAMLAVFIGTLTLIAGQYFDMSLYDNFLFALALAVSVVPEGLPAAILVALSLSMKKLIKKNVLAKKLSAVETLGSVSIICTDKTGTITRNELTVVRALLNDETVEIDGVGYSPRGNFSVNGQTVDGQSIKNLGLLFKIGTLCNDASLVRDNETYKVVGDPTEGALIVAGKKYNPAENFYEKNEIKVGENPFSSDRMMMSVILKNSDTVSYVKGSPDLMIDLCVSRLAGDAVVPMLDSDRKNIRDAYNSMSAEALRVLAFAYRKLDGIAESEYKTESERNLVWVGMMAMIDPPREDIAQSIEECQALGIKVIMITGDYEITARAIAKNIGLIKDDYPSEVINGKTLDTLDDKEIYRLVRNQDIVFARINPAQKLRIASILKDNKQVIAMTGDGVNDAPALKKADIGVAMGIIGTDVSKEASDMILLDDNFSSIVNGVKEGRTVFSNLKKFVHYVFTSNTSELFTVIFGVILHIPSPISAVQILAIDLGTDILPSFSLSLEPPEPGTQKSKFINSRNSVMSIKGFRRIIFMGINMAAGATAAFIWSMMRGGWEFGQAIGSNPELYIKSSTAAYAVLSMTQMANLLQSRSETLSPFQLGFFRNKYAISAIFMSVGILLLFMYLPFCQEYLGMRPIDGKDWLVVVLVTISVFLFEEVRKSGKM